MDTPYRLVYGFILIILIVFVEEIPSEYKNLADSLLGRILTVGIAYGVIYFMGWIYGLLTVLAYLMLIHGSRRIVFSEGFEGGGTINEKKIVGKRWFVEKVLGETPKKIETDKVQTSAIEGISSGSLMN
jgi:hypothetical protein